MTRTESAFALTLALAIAWATYASLRAVYEAVNEPEEIRMCVSETGHKEVECP